MAAEAKATKMNADKAIPEAGLTAPEKAIKATVDAITAAAKDPASAPQLAPQLTTNAANQDGAQARTAMEKSMEQMTRSAEGFYKVTEEAVEFGRGNVEALTKATQTYVSGLQELGKQAFAAFQSLNEQAVQNAKAMTSVRSLKDAAEMQTNFAKAQIEKSISEATKLNEAAFKLAEQSSAPIAARMTLAFEKLSRPVAFS